MSIPLIVAGVLGFLGVAIHGVAGELLVVKKLSPDSLPATRFGGPRTTLAMIQVTWRMTTTAFLTLAVALILAGSAFHGDTRRAVGHISAAASTGFALLTIAGGASGAHPLRSLLRHPAPVLLSTTAALAWWGAA